MASARKKQDEKHLKILRELVSLPANKQCFDCYQRGPTYINMTIGSFVCTSCSGMLRGLTPPHRVKSISMTSFSPEEIELIKSRGNEYCRRIWLGLYDANHGHTTTKDEQQIKDFMIAKYEKKTYYLDAAVANKNGFSPNGTMSDSRTSTPTPSIKSGTPETKPLSTLLGQQPSKSPFSLKLQQNSTVSTDNMFTPDKTEFLTDFTSDPFSSTQFNTQDTSNQPSFANFDNFTSSSSMPGALTLTAQSPAFGSPARKSTSGTVFGQNLNSVPPPPSEDKYAALKDLDCLMKSQQQQQHHQQQQQQQQQQHQHQHHQHPQHRLSDPMHMSDWSNGSPWASANGGANHTAFGSPAQTTVNPFTVAPADPWASTNGATHGVNSAFVGNPFQARQNIGTTITHGFGWPTMTNGSGSQPLNGQQPFTSSQSLQSMHLPAKPWPNPFAIGGTPTPASHSSNPFL